MNLGSSKKSMRSMRTMKSIKYMKYMKSINVTFGRIHLRVQWIIHPMCLHLLLLRHHCAKFVVHCIQDLDSAEFSQFLMNPSSDRIQWDFTVPDPDPFRLLIDCLFWSLILNTINRYTVLHWMTAPALIIFVNQI